MRYLARFYQTDCIELEVEADTSGSAIERSFELFHEGLGVPNPHGTTWEFDSIERIEEES